ncbi:50S ribosomal protein L9 [Aerococcaceae bacterium DSM 111021]|nr:50S ribosomal protein L9 [Aerococcaceae bacterium DSM 111021]
MKVILLKDVKKQGKKGEVVEVSDGYGRNYLIKNNLAKMADGAALNQLQSKKEAEARVAKEELTESKLVKEAIEKEDTVVTISAKTGEDGRLFGTIPSKQIAEELEKQYGIKVDRRKIQLSENLSSLGSYNVTVKLHTKVSADIKVHVVGQ